MSRPKTLLVLSTVILSAHAIAGDQSEPTVGVILKEEGVAPGYVLYTPLNANETYLIDNDGRVVHEWVDDLPAGNSVYLLDDGSLLRCSDNGPAPGSIIAAGGDGGCIRRFDWDGNRTWNFCLNTPEYRLHHDVELLPNGNVLAIAWEYRSFEEAVQHGRDPSTMSTHDSLWPLYIIEVEPDADGEGGDIVWEWRVWDHIVQDFNPDADNYGIPSENPGKVDINQFRNQSGDWIHANSIDYNASLDQILISTPFLNEIWIIDHGTTTEEAAGPAGDLLYRWGNPRIYGRGTNDDQQSFFQHDARWVEEGLPGAGNITLFNNGQGRPDGNYSTVLELVPPVTPAGDYELPEGGAYGPESATVLFVADPAESFYSNIICGAERQPNGNTLICKGRGAGTNTRSGEFYEITPDGELVWLYASPIAIGGAPIRQGCPSNNALVFRASRYAPDHPGLAGRDLTPGELLELPRCPGDFDCDGVIDGSDLTELLGAWGTDNPALDLDGDGTVAGGDLTLLLGGWGLCL